MMISKRTPLLEYEGICVLTAILWKKKIRDDDGFENVPFMLNHDQEKLSFMTIFTPRLCDIIFLPDHVVNKVLENIIYLKGETRDIPTSVRDELSAFSKITWLLPTISPQSICQRKQSYSYQSVLRSERWHLLFISFI